MSIQSAIDGIVASKSNIRIAINNKGGNVSSSAKLSTYATAINNLSTSMAVSRNVSAGGPTSPYSADFTIPANTTQAFLIVNSLFVGNDNTFALTRKSGASVTITTQLSKTNTNWDSYGYSPIRNSTITYKITKARGTASVVTLSVSNPYGLAGVSSHLVTN